MFSTPICSAETLITENFSRTGILLRWLPAVPLPAVGARLTVDVELPRLPGALPRVMRCAAEVVRIELSADDHQLIGLTIGKIRFVQAAERVAPQDLKSMPPATSLLN